MKLENAMNFLYSAQDFAPWNDIMWQKDKLSYIINHFQVFLLILYSTQDFAPWRSSRADRATLFCVIGPSQFWLLRSFALFVLKVFVLFVLFVIGPRQFWLLRLFVTPIICLITGPLCGGLVSLKTKVWSRQERRGWIEEQNGQLRGTEQSHREPNMQLCTMHYQLPASLKLVPDHVARLPLSKVWLAGRWQAEWLAAPTCLLPYSTLEPVTASQGVARPFSWRGGGASLGYLPNFTYLAFIWRFKIAKTFITCLWDFLHNVWMISRIKHWIAFGMWMCLLTMCAWILNLDHIILYSGSDKAAISYIGVTPCRGISLRI